MVVRLLKTNNFMVIKIDFEENIFWDIILKML